MLTRAGASAIGGLSLTGRPHREVSQRRAPAAATDLSSGYQPRTGIRSNGDYDFSCLGIARAHSGRMNVTVSFRASSSGSGPRADTITPSPPFPPFLPQRDVQELNDQAARRLAARITRVPVQASGCMACCSAPILRP